MDLDGSRFEIKINAISHIIEVIDDKLDESPNLIEQEYLWKRKEVNQKKLKELINRISK